MAGKGKIGVGLILIGAMVAVFLFTTGAKKGLVGDLNDDGVLSSEDLDILMQYILGYPISEISPLSEEEFLRRADVNGDGIIDSGDTVALNNLIIAQS